MKSGSVELATSTCIIPEMVPASIFMNSYQFNINLILYNRSECEIRDPPPFANFCETKLTKKKMDWSSSGLVDKMEIAKREVAGSNLGHAKN